jgi:hypothetical protein
MRVSVFKVDGDEPAGGSQKFLSSQVTSARGEFNFAVVPGHYRLAVLPGNDSRFLNHYSEVIKVEGNTSFTITAGTGSVISGKILTSEGRGFTSGSVVALGFGENAYRAQSEISERGIYSLVLPKGTYDLAYSACSNERPGVSDTTHSDDPNDEFIIPLESETAETVTTSSFQVDVGRDLPFDLIFPDLIEFPVIVVDNVEEAIADAQVSLQPVWEEEKGLHAEFDFTARRRTDKRGNASFFVQPGRYRLRVEPHEGSSFFNHKEDDVKVEAGLRKTVTLAQGHRLRGQVNFDTKPQAGCSVSITSAATQEHVNVRSNSEGKFSAVLAGGTYRVAVIPSLPDSAGPQKNGGGQKGLAPWVKSIVVGGDTQVAIKLREGVLVSGKVTDEFEQPRRGVRVFAFENRTDLTSESSLLDAVNSAITDAGGRYAFHLLPGGYKLVVHRDFGKAQEVVLPNESLVANLTWTGWYQVRFEVQTEDGRPIPWTRLRCFPYSKEFDLNQALAVDSELLPNDRLMADEKGFCQITLAAGVYSFEFSPPKDADFVQRIIRQLSVNGDLNRKITLGKAVGSNAGAGKAGSTQST